MPCNRPQQQPYIPSGLYVTVDVRKRSKRIPPPPPPLLLVLLLLLLLLLLESTEERNFIIIIIIIIGLLLIPSIFMMIPMFREMHMNELTHGTYPWASLQPEARRCMGELSYSFRHTYYLN
jgi:hypothetical protein